MSRSSIDERRLAKAWELLAWALWLRCQAGATEEALLHAVEHAQRAGDGRTEAQSLNLLLGAVFFGPLPVPEGIHRCQEIVARTAEQPRILSSGLRALAGLRAMEGSFDEARTLVALCGAILEDLGLRVTAASLSETAAIIEMLAGDPAAAERILRSGYAELEQMGETSNSADLAAMLARALEAQGQADEALRFSEISSRIAAEDDLSPQVQWRAARAKALAGLGQTAEPSGWLRRPSRSRPRATSSSSAATRCSCRARSCDRGRAGRRGGGGRSGAGALRAKAEHGVGGPGTHLPYGPGVTPPERGFWGRRFRR